MLIGVPKELAAGEKRVATVPDVVEKLVKLGLENVKMRHLLDPESSDASWKTFRDVDPQMLQSIYTGQRAAPLPQAWLELKPDKVVVTSRNGAKSSAM